MNGDPLSRDHGYPIRAVIPGYIGARSVKFLQMIRIQDKESKAYHQQLDYKILPEHVGRCDRVHGMQESWHSSTALGRE